jgi:hypothetical protein
LSYHIAEASLYVALAAANLLRRLGIELGNFLSATRVRS